MLKILTMIVLAFSQSVFAESSATQPPSSATQPPSSATQPPSSATQPPSSATVAQSSISGIPRKIPTSDFAARALTLYPILSPYGDKVIVELNLSDLKNPNHNKVMGIYTLATADVITIPLHKNMDLRWYRWAGNGKILFSVGQTVRYFDDEAYATRLLSYDIASRHIQLIAENNSALIGDNLIYVEPSGNWLLLSMQASVYDYPSVFKIDLATFKMHEVVHPREDVWDWFADTDGIVRGGFGYDENSWSMVYRRTADDKFRNLGEARYDDQSASYNLLRLASGSDEGFVLSNKASGRDALYKFNFATKTLGDLVFKNDTNDVTDYSLSEDGKTVRAVWFTTDHDRIEWFDPKMKAYQHDIDTALSQNENWIGSRSKDDSRMIVWTGGSNNPGQYYVYIPYEGKMHKLSDINDRLKPSELASATYTHYKARDGLDIPAYLTLPLGRLAKSLPLIILPHGGPFDVRDNMDFDPEVQMLANRGYAVLQPNYRGSGGYGKAFYQKGEGQWGRQMQDDLDDGMDWLVKQGIVDPKRVCLDGASYGGYAALWGATRNPERYRCAASYAGVSDLNKQLKYQTEFKISKKYRKDWQKAVKGKEDFDTRTVSPIYTVSQLKVPILLMHGDADQTVPYKQSETYAAALANAGKKFEFYTHEKEGHGFASNENLKDWLDKLDAFLGKYNPAD